MSSDHPPFIDATEMSEPEQNQEGESEPADDQTRPQTSHYQVLTDVELEDIAAGFADNNQTSCLGSGSMTTAG